MGEGEGEGEILVYAALHRQGEQAGRETSRPGSERILGSLCDDGSWLSSTHHHHYHHPPCLSRCVALFSYLNRAGSGPSPRLQMG